MTQEFYLNRFDLDNHAESVLKFSFGVHSLFRLCFDFVVNNPSGFPDSELSSLPATIRKMLAERLEDDEAFGSNPDPPTDPPFERRIFQAGI